MSAIKDISV